MSGISADIEQGRITANGVEFTYLSAGTPGAPLALCLHGFPDTAHTWRHLLPALAAAGYHAVAPFLRGYAPTQVPADGRYQSGVLAVDANELHQAFGADGRAVIIGHDWGAAATYAAANIAPERWSKVVTLAVPTADVLGMAMFTDTRQLKLSWYMFFFQSPLADLVVPSIDLAFIDMLWADWSPGYPAAEDVELVKQSLRDPANLAAAIGYYRATLGDGYKDPSLAEAQAATAVTPKQPLLYLHGRNDGCVSVRSAEAMAATAPANVQVSVVDGVGHFLQLEQPDQVNGQILAFLA